MSGMLQIGRLCHLHRTRGPVNDQPCSTSFNQQFVQPFQGLQSGRFLLTFYPVERRRALRVSVKATGSGKVNGRALRQETQALNIAFVSAEVSPWSKTGGLGDVVGGLPVELSKRGHKVMSISPRYDQYEDAWDTSVQVEIDGERVGFFHARKQGVDRVFIDHPAFLAKVWGKTGGKLYGQKSGADFSDNQRRFLLFNKAALEALRVLPFSPGTGTVVVANDWHTALLPVLVKDVYQPAGEFTDTKTALCIHNIAYQGRFWRKDWPVLGLPDNVLPKFAFEDGYERVYTEDESEEMAKRPPSGKRYEKINWLKAGILSADKLLTVSPNYATEIASDDEKGVELASVVRDAGGLEGIVNGCDVNEWSPFSDKYLDVKYDADTMAEGKAIAKETLQAELGLPVDPDIPVFGFIGRLEEQKGVDIMIDALPTVAKAGGVQVVVLGTGKKDMEADVEALDKEFPETVKGVVKFNVPLAHLIIAGADFMLVPSRFEPCGLIQLHAMNYGTVPVVASTGGLVDTVKDGVTGFHAGRFDPDKLRKEDSAALASTISRAAEAFQTPAFETMQERCIAQELSWEKPARKWESVLEELWSPSIAAAPQKAAAVEERRSTYPTPVQTVNKEGDALPAGAMEAKRAANAVVLEDAARAKAESPPKPSAPKHEAPSASSSPATSYISKPFAAPQVSTASEAAAPPSAPAAEATPAIQTPSTPSSSAAGKSKVATAKASAPKAASAKKAAATKKPAAAKKSAAASKSVAASKPKAASRAKTTAASRKSTTSKSAAASKSVTASKPKAAPMAKATAASQESTT